MHGQQNLNYKVVVFEELCILFHFNI